MLYIYVNAFVWVAFVGGGGCASVRQRHLQCKFYGVAQIVRSFRSEMICYYCYCESCISDDYVIDI